MSKSKIAAVLSAAEKVLILTHVSADGDALGSSLGLGLMLRNEGKTVQILLEEPVSPTFTFLPGQQIIKVTGDEVCVDQSWVAVALDSGDKARLASRQSLFDQCGQTINIDHHMTNTGFADLNLVEESASTSDLLIPLFDEMKLELQRDAAMCLYTGLMTDTGGFRFSNATPTAFRHAARLVDTGINIAEISHRVFELTTFPKLLLTSLAVETIEMAAGGSVATMTISKEMLERSGASDTDVEGLVNIHRNIRGVEAVAMLREKSEGVIRVNLRSNTRVDCAAIALQYGGGGHVRAAGFSLELPLEVARKKVAEALEAAL